MKAVDLGLNLDWKYVFFSLKEILNFIIWFNLQRKKNQY